MPLHSEEHSAVNLWGVENSNISRTLLSSPLSFTLHLARELRCHRIQAHALLAWYYAASSQAMQQLPHTWLAAGPASTVHTPLTAWALKPV